MDIKYIFAELQEVIEKLKLKVIYYETENKNLRIKIRELKDYIRKM